MTKDEINDYLTTELFGECWHEPKVNREWHGETDIVVVRCRRCGNDLGYPDQVSFHENYFTWEGAGKVIEAMRAKGYNVRMTAHKEGYRAWFTVFQVCYCDVAEEAVCRAAAEYLKKEQAAREAENDKG